MRKKQYTKKDALAILKKTGIVVSPSIEHSTENAYDWVTIMVLADMLLEMELYRSKELTDHQRRSANRFLDGSGLAIGGMTIGLDVEQELHQALYEIDILGFEIAEGADRDGNIDWQSTLEVLARVYDQELSGDDARERLWTLRPKLDLIDGTLVYKGDPRVTETYEITTWTDPEDPDDYEQEIGFVDEEGEYMGPDPSFEEDDDLDQGTVVTRTAQHLLDNGATEPSSSTEAVSYSWSEADQDYRTGANEIHSYHLKGYSPQQLKEIQLIVCPPRRGGR